MHPTEITLLVLIGIPGSGKTTVAKHLRSLGWTYISQEALGSHGACEKDCIEALKAGVNLVIGGCNSKPSERRTWVELGRNFCTHHARIHVVALQLLLPRELCLARLTSPSDQQAPLRRDEAASIIDECYRDFASVDPSEGFHRVLTAHSDTEVWDALHCLTHPASSWHPRQHSPTGHSAAQPPFYNSGHHSPAQPPYSYSNRFPGQPPFYGSSHLPAQVPFPHSRHFPAQPPFGNGRPPHTALHAHLDPQHEWSQHRSYYGTGARDPHWHQGFSPPDLSSFTLPSHLPHNGHHPQPSASYSQWASPSAPSSAWGADHESSPWSAPGHSKNHKRIADPGSPNYRGWFAAEPELSGHPDNGNATNQEPENAYLNGANKRQQHNLFALYANPRSTAKYDETADPEGRPLLLFDLNGTLTQHTAARRSSGQTRLRPGVKALRRLVPHFRLGIYTSATVRTAHTALQMLEAECQETVTETEPSSGTDACVPPLFEPRLVLSRDHTSPMPKSVIDITPGAKPWDTVKPLSRWFEHLDRVILFDDDAHKASPGEESNMVLVPGWVEEQADCRVLETMVEVLLETVAGLGPDTDVRTFTAAISTRLHEVAAAAAEKATVAADSNEISLLDAEDVDGSAKEVTVAAETNEVDVDGSATEIKIKEVDVDCSATDVETKEVNVDCSATEVAVVAETNEVIAILADAVDVTVVDGHVPAGDIEAAALVDGDIQVSVKKASFGTDGNQVVTRDADDVAAIPLN